MNHIPDLADRCLTGEKHHSDFTGRQFKERIAIFFGHQLRKCTGTSDDLPAFSLFELDIVNLGSQRNIHQRQIIAGFDIRCRTGHDRIADREIHGSQNISFFTIYIVQQRDS